MCVQITQRKSVVLLYSYILYDYTLKSLQINQFIIILQIQYAYFASSSINIDLYNYCLLVYYFNFTQMKYSSHNSITPYVFLYLINRGYIVISYSSLTQLFINLAFTINLNYYTGFKKDVIILCYGFFRASIRLPTSARLILSTLKTCVRLAGKHCRV